MSFPVQTGQRTKSVGSTPLLPFLSSFTLKKTPLLLFYFLISKKLLYSGERVEE